MSHLVFLPSNAVQTAGRQVFTTSLLVAEIFEKQHKHVLRDIDELDCSDDFRLLNFGESFREVVTGSNFGPRQESYFEISKDGFTFLSVEQLGRQILHKASITPEERNAILAGLRQMGYSRW